MELLSGYYREEGDDSASLLLEQYAYGEIPFCLGCVCVGESLEGSREGGEFTGWLLGWFRRIDLKRAVRQPEKWFERKEEELRREALCRSAHMEKISMAGILCLGERFLIFQRGAYEAYLCNMEFGRSVLRPVEGFYGSRREAFMCGAYGNSEALWTCTGSMEPGIGILLTTEKLCEILSRDKLEECLAVGEIHSGEQTQKRVREMGMAAKRQGNTMAALLLEVRDAKR